MKTLAFINAQNEVHRFSGLLSWQLEHTEAMACRDCEDYLRLGLQAYHWLRTAHQHIQDDVTSGEISYCEELEQSLTQLYNIWLEPSASAEAWAASLEQKGYIVDKFAEFRRCCEEAKDILEQRIFVNAARRSRLSDSGNEATNEDW